MRATGQVRSDLMALRALISNGVSTTAERIASLESSLSAVATSGDYADLSNKPILGELAALDSITTTKISDWSSATSSFVTAASLAPYAKTGDLASVALSGAYGDLSGAPTLGALAAQDSVTHLQVSDWSAATANFLTAHQDVSGLLPKTGGEVTGEFAWSKSAEISGETRQHRVTIAMNATSLNFGAYDNTNRHWVWLANPDGENTFFGNASSASRATADADGNTIAATYATKSSLATTEIPLTDSGYVTFSALKAWRSGNVVVVYIRFTLPATAPSSFTVVATGLPPPPEQVQTVISTWAASFSRACIAAVETDGSLRLTYGRNSFTYCGTFCYVTSESA